jgi:hypothetical protein
MFAIVNYEDRQATPFQVEVKSPDKNLKVDKAVDGQSHCERLPGQS